MLEKIANLKTLRNLTGLSRSLVKQNNFSTLRCHPSRLTVTAQPKPLWNCVPKPINGSLSAQLMKNNLCQVRLQSTVHGDHVNLWKLERIVAITFVPLLPLCLILENSVLDSALAILTVMHVHWGLEAIIVDYARPIVVGNVVPKVCFVLLYLASAMTLAGLLVLAYNGPGISRVIKDGWAIGKKEKS